MLNLCDYVINFQAQFLDTQQTRILKLNFYNVHFHSIIYYKLTVFIQHLQWVIG